MDTASIRSRGLARWRSFRAMLPRGVLSRGGRGADAGTRFTFVSRRYATTLIVPLSATH